MPHTPATPVSDAVDILHGESIPDPYRWLEDGESAETRAWTERRTRSPSRYLGAVPGRGRAFAAAWTSCSPSARSSVPAPVRGRYFYQRRDGRQNQPVLYVREGVNGDGPRAGRSQRPRSGAGTTALDWYYPSDDGRLLAYGLSEDGSEQSVLHVLDVDTGAQLLATASRTPAPRISPGFPTAPASTTPAIPRPARCPRARSTTTAPSTSTGSAPTRRATRCLQARPRRSTGRA